MIVRHNKMSSLYSIKAILILDQDGKRILAKVSQFKKLVSF